MLTACGRDLSVIGHYPVGTLGWMFALFTLVTVFGWYRRHLIPLP